MTNAFKPDTSVSFDALSFLAALQQRYASGPRAGLTQEQLQMCARWDNLYPAEKLRIANAATKEGRSFLTGEDLTAEQVEAAPQ